MALPCAIHREEAYAMRFSPFLFVMAGGVLLATLAGYLAGRIVTLQSASPPSLLVDDQRRPVPVVRIDGFKEGAIVGSVLGEARVAFGPELALLSSSGGTFTLDATALLREAISPAVPPGMKFVASKRGKKFYPVHSTAGQNLSPANRVYFNTAEEAKAAGFRS